MNLGPFIRPVSLLAILIAISPGCSTANAPDKGDVSRIEDVYRKRIPYAYPGNVLIRLKSVYVHRGFYETMDTRVSATFVPIEYLYKGRNGGGGFGGGGGGGYGSPFDQKPVETERGKPFVVYFSDLGLVDHHAKSIGNLILSCADEAKPGQLKLNLILAVPEDDVKKDANYNFDPDWTNWVVESVEIHK